MYAMKTLIVSILLFVISASMASAGTYKCKDENGKVTYSETSFCTMNAASKVYAGPKEGDSESAARIRTEMQAQTQAQTIEQKNQKCKALLDEMSSIIPSNNSSLGGMLADSTKKKDIRYKYEAQCLSDSARQANQQKRADENTNQQLRQIQNTQQQMKQQQDHDKIFGKTCKPDGLGNLKCY
jgi:hypothetical protein